MRFIRAIKELTNEPTEEAKKENTKEFKQDEQMKPNSL
jgi:hypothetical protein